MFVRNNKSSASLHHIHDKFFKKAFSNPKFAKDLLVLSLSADIRKLFDLDNLKPAKEVISNSKNQELLFDLNYTTSLKKYPDCPVHFGIIIEHTTRMLKDTVKRLHTYCVEEMNRTGGLVRGVLFYQGEKPIDIPTNYIELLLKKELPHGAVTQLLPLYPNFPFSVISLANTPDKVLTLEGILSSPCLLAMKYAKRFTEKIITMILSGCHMLPFDYKKNLVEWLISYIEMTDNNYSAEKIAVIESNHFPNLKEEARVMTEEVLIGFEGIRQSAHEQGLAEGLAKGLAKGRAERERLVLSLLHAGVDPKIICNSAQISERDLKELKKKFEQ